MFAIIFNALFLFAEAAGGHSESGGFMKFWNTYMNYPGFELWKFINLAVFLGILYYLLRKPVSEAFKARREEIRAELIKAKAERDAAVAKLEEVEVRLSRLDMEVTAIKEKARVDADMEKERIAAQTENDIAKMREQAGNEIARAGQMAKHDLRKFSAEESIRLAEEMLRGKLNADADAKLVRAGIQELGGVN
jgi:F0F1-type ATP synthase membrane subunit b/b'